MKLALSFAVCLAVAFLSGAEAGNQPSAAPTLAPTLEYSKLLAERNKLLEPVPLFGRHFPAVSHSRRPNVAASSSPFVCFVCVCLLVRYRENQQAQKLAQLRKDGWDNQSA